MERAVIGLVLTQIDRKVSVVHTFGHAFSARYPVQQGLVHAVLGPHVLRYVLEETDGYAELLAEGLGVEATESGQDELGQAVVEAVAAVRDGFDLPNRLRDVDIGERADFPALAEFVLDDRSTSLAPDGLDPTQRDIERVLEAA